MNDRSIIEAIQSITQTRLTDRVYIVSCNVESVNEEKRTCICSVIEGRVETEFEASLMAVVDDGILFVPSVDSTVKVIMSDYTKPFVCQYSQLDKAVLIVGDSVLKIQEDLIEFNGGQLDAFVKLLPLVQKLNNLENAYNSLVAKFNNHTHILTLSSGTGTAAITANPESTVLTTTQKSDLENPKIKQ